MPNMVKENGEQCAKQVYQSYEWILIQSKNEKSCWYESLWGECLFYYILELELNTVRYYDQPVEIPIKFFNIELKNVEWNHIPDYLVFKDNPVPILYQIQ